MDHSPAAQPLPPYGMGNIPSWPDLLPLRQKLAIPAQGHSLFLWGDRRVHGVALRTAARTLTHGLQVAVVDAGMAFQVTPIVAMAQACRIAPDVFLRRVHIVRAFTCWQLTTLLCERLHPLLATHPIGLVILLEPLTAFFDEDVTYQEAKLLFQRVLQTLAGLSTSVPRPLIVQTVPAHQTPRRLFARDLLRVVDMGLRLLPGEGRWSVEVVKPRPPTHPPTAHPT
jgi:hypothetical protein